MENLPKTNIISQATVGYILVYSYQYMIFEFIMLFISPVILFTDHHQSKVYKGFDAGQD
jgi:hypothetical protein